MSIETETLRLSLLAQLDRHEPIDIKRIDQYLHMRRQDYQQAQVIQESRLEEMRQRTRELTGAIQLTPDQIKLNPSTVDRIHAESDLYNRAAISWVESEVCPWIDSKASDIAAGILILIKEIL